MTKFPMAVLCLMCFSPDAGAGQSRILHGLFCTTPAQVEETLQHVRQNMTITAAVGLTNKNEVACVHATLVRYMVVDAVVTGHVPQSGTMEKIYAATLVGVLVGGNPRPVSPAVPIYFVTRDPMPQVPELGET